MKALVLSLIHILFSIILSTKESGCFLFFRSSCLLYTSSSGIGVKNVNDRLKIYFGEKYGISIKSELDEGTVVTVRIPQIRKENENEIQV